MSRQVVVPDTVAEKAAKIAAKRDMTRKEAIRLMCRSTAGYDV